MEEKYSIICFGDSNTYGAGGFGDLRYEASGRWPDILAQDPAFSEKYDFVNMGENGREIPDTLFKIGSIRRKMSDYEPVALIVIMLGSNDMIRLFRYGMNKIISRMELFIRELLDWRPDPAGILLIAPVPTELDSYGPEGVDIDDHSREAADAYRELADKYGLHFADAGKWNIELGPDGVHFAEYGHIVFAQALKGELLHILS